VGGEERGEDWEVLWCDEDGDGEATEGELMCQVQEWEHVALGWVRKHQDVCCHAGGGRHGASLPAGGVNSLWNRWKGQNVILGNDLCRKSDFIFSNKEKVGNN
jgi:hypothetical protein